MQRRRSLRAQTDLPVSVYADGFMFSCRAVDLSPHGVVIERSPGLEQHEARPVYWLRFPMDGGIVALARPAWRRGLTQAFRFVEIADTDRLTLAEHMDRSVRAGMALH